ncbi:hypothetical protein MMC15_003761 [Xylographa vitiligo]|nr:hypothetical protein [Xylographa vitiligo]
MPKASPVILILGSGPNVGQSVARAFAAKGYKVAVASRTSKEEDSTADQVNISSDLSDPDSVTKIFSKVKELLGLPSVVVYNAAAFTASDAKNPLSLPLTNFTRDMNINTTSAFVAAQQAVLGFEQLSDSVTKTFIYTGNVLNTTTMVPLMYLGIGKSATAHMIQCAATAYKDRGYRFYYADERKADGSAAFTIDGEAHGKLYASLAEAESQRPWLQTFVKGVGYKHFLTD